MAQDPSAPAGSEEIRRWVMELGDPSFKVRERAQERLADGGPEMIPVLERVAKEDPNPERASRALDLVSLVRRRARLRRWGLPTTPEFGRIADAKAPGALDRLLDETDCWDQTPEAKAAFCVKGLSPLSASAALAAAYKKFLGDPRPRVRWEALICSHALCDGSWIPGLSPLVRDEDRKVRMLAVVLLAGLKTDEAVRELFPALEDPDLQVRHRAAAFLFAHREGMLLKDRAGALRDGKDPVLKEYGFLVSLPADGEKRAEEARRILSREAPGGEPEERVCAAIFLAARHKCEDLVPRLVAIAKDGKKTVRSRCAALLALEAFGAAKSADALGACLSDSDIQVRMQAASVLLRKGGESKWEPALRRGLRISAPVVRILVPEWGEAAVSARFHAVMEDLPTGDLSLSPVGDWFVREVSPQGMAREALKGIDR